MESYYFIGIGGVSMSALAVMLKNMGHDVQGSDVVQGRGTKILEEYKIKVDFEFNPIAIENSDVIVFSSAIKEDDERFVFAKKLNKKMLSRGEILGEISNKFENVIAVAGSHGKTTTTAMIANILSVAGKEPTLHLGGFKIDDGKNFILGKNKYFVTEACEYHDNFLFLHPYLSVVTNVEKEHLDYFKTFSKEMKSFEKFKKNSKIVIDNFENIKAKDISHNDHGELCFSLWENDRKIFDLKLHLCEDVNTQNCIYSYLVAKKLGISDCLIKLGLESFYGVSMRFERKKCLYFNDVFYDYAHHPTEIKNSISTAIKIFKDRTIVTIFQPHTYSRTKFLFNEFISVFKDVEIPIFFKTYSARESEKDGMSSAEFCEELKKINSKTQYFDDYHVLFAFLYSLKENNPVLLFLGAGNLQDILHKKQFTT